MKILDKDIAKRIKRLGTETAFAVSAEAAGFAAQGNKIYPFHLGDMNLPTPKNIIEAAIKAIIDGKTGYCPNAGIPQLREILATDINNSHGTHYTAENVSLQPGGKPVIGKFLTTLMNPGDGVLYPNPGYPIFESQIKFLGGRALPYGIIEDNDHFRLNIDSLKKKITSKTKILILNDLHNPTGAICSPEEYAELQALVLKHNLFVLCDEAYFDIRYEGKSNSFAALPGMAERSVILYSFSKKFSMTGWRLGAAIGPKKIIDVITKLNINMESCPNHFVQYAAIEALTGDQTEPAKIIRALKQRRDLVFNILNYIPGVRCFKPQATFYLYPDITTAMERKNIHDYEEFRKALLHKIGISICTRLHFGQPFKGEKKFYIRLAYAGICLGEIAEGLTRLEDFLKN